MALSVFEVESWYVAEGKKNEHDNAMRAWLDWVNENRDLFPEWKRLRYFLY